LDFDNDTRCGVDSFKLVFIVCLALFSISVKSQSTEDIPPISYVYPVNGGYTDSFDEVAMVVVKNLQTFYGCSKSDCRNPV
jgi:hypothetical protein